MLRGVRRFAHAAYAAEAGAVRSRWRRRTGFGRWLVVVLVVLVGVVDVVDRSTANYHSIW